MSTLRQHAVTRVLRTRANAAETRRGLWTDARAGAAASGKAPSPRCAFRDRRRERRAAPGGADTARTTSSGRGRLGVEPRQVVQLVEAGDGRLVTEGAVSAAMVVGP